jgi:Ni,Fe-hydrogenase III large subunit/Ni,Fe-hydrogenase III component G
MDFNQLVKRLTEHSGVLSFNETYPDEAYIEIPAASFKDACLKFHKELRSPVMMFFACDERAEKNSFGLYCTFLSARHRKWVFLKTSAPEGARSFPSIAKEIASAGLFEREIKEMFGLEPEGALDKRSLRLHEETWPENNFPLCKDFKFNAGAASVYGQYSFMKVQGEGIFEVPVGPVHAGIIGPGHFHFSVAGEPVINLEIRLGFTHRGVEKLFEGKNFEEGARLAECVCGDAAFAYSQAFCQAIEKISSAKIERSHSCIRTIFLELERIYNHTADIGGMAVDVGFSAPAMLAQIIKENLLQLNKLLASNRYLKGVNSPGGINNDTYMEKIAGSSPALSAIRNDINALEKILMNSVSFMDRVDGTGILYKKTAEDLGITGPAARASGISMDLRDVFPGVYALQNLQPAKNETGDARARLDIRFKEIRNSFEIIKQCAAVLGRETPCSRAGITPKKGAGLGYVEGWRGPVLFWVKTGEKGIIERCKIVDPSFLNWAGLAYCMPGNIIPDFPLCNKSFNLSYPGSDL